jgi:YVTN family beta-propeller protein
MLPAQYRVTLLILFVGAFNLASSFGQCPAPYTLSANTPSQNATLGTWTAPATGGSYAVSITAAGAKGGGSGGGSGAVITGIFIINAGQKIDVTAGSTGTGDNLYAGGGGGSGAYIDGTQTLLLIAGGGGGGGSIVGGPGQITTSGQSMTVAGADPVGTGGTQGSGGTAGTGGGGGGYLSAGGTYSSVSFGTRFGGGSGFAGAGGANGNYAGGGGVGGGGGGANDIAVGPSGNGGGGGYSGGSGGSSYVGGGGGGSINNGINQINTPGVNAGGGYVIVTCQGTVSVSSSAGNNQSATVSTTFATPLSVTLSANSDPLSGVSVTFTAPSSGASGTFSNSTTTITVNTDQNGVATAGTFTANGTAGSYNVTATVASTTLAMNFSLTNSLAFTTCPSTYTLNANSPSVNATTGTWTTPATGGPYLIKITAAGAQGGGGGPVPGGKGAAMQGTFVVSAGQTLNITAGSPGESPGAEAFFNGQYYSTGGGGGGGSGVYTGTSLNPTILIVAGGGGGSNLSASGLGGNVTTCGGGGTACSGGGGASYQYMGSGGGGLTASGNTNASWGNAGEGGVSGSGGAGVLNYYNSLGAEGSGGGGIGGGGSGGGGGGPQTGNYFDGGGGGGGGYSGGDGGQSGAGGGGGSINNGTNQTNTPGSNAGGGYVTIECLGPAGATSSVLSVDGTSTICKGSSANLVVAITGGTSPYTIIYQDNNNNQFIVNNYTSGSNIQVSPTVTTTYSMVSVTDASSNTGTGNSGTPTITVNPLPIVNAVTDQVACNNSATAAVNFSGSSGTTFNWTNNTPSIGLAASGTGDIASFNATNATNAPVNATVTVTPTNSSFAYITNEQSNNVSVINTATNTVVATVVVGKLPYGISVSPDASKVYVTTNSGSNDLTVINTATNIVVATVGVGAQPTGVSVSPDGNKVYVTNTGSNNLSVINTATNTVVATVGLGVNPFGVSVSPDGSNVYVANIGSANVSVINTATNTVVATLGVGANPTGVAVSPDGSKVYVTSQGPNNVSVINTATNTVVATVGVGLRPNGICVSPDGSKVYVSNLGSDNVSVINTATNTVVATVAVGTSPAGVSLSPDGSKVYVANFNSNNVSVISSATNTIVATVSVGIQPVALGNFISSAVACTGSSKTFQITVNPLPSATISGTIAVCQNAAQPNITFAGSGGTAPYTFSYAVGLGDPQTIADDGSGSVTLAVPATTPGTLTYNLLSVQNASSTHCGQTLSGQSASVTINATPTGSISGGGTYCSGANTTTSLTLSVTGSGTISGTLSGGTPFTGTAPTIQVSVSPTTTTTYTIATLSDANCTAQSSDLSGRATVTVNSRPTGSISGGGTYCSGTNTTTSLTLAVTGSGTISGTLSDNTSFSGTAPTINVSVTPSSTTTYTIATLQDANNCTAQLSDLSGSAMVTVNPAPTATINGTTAVCQNASSPGVTFSGSGGTAPYTFTYSINGVTQPTVSDDGSGTITISAPATNAGNYVYTLLSVQDNSANPCSQNITGQSATITINPPPAATISGTTAVCQNSTQPNITFNGSGGTAPFTFTYSLNDGTTTTAGLTVKGNPATVSVFTNAAGIYTYTLTSVQDANNCPQVLSPQSVQIMVNALPNANISTASMVTAASTGNIASVDNAGTGAVYNWSITNGAITNGAGTNSITYTAGISGNVSLSVSVTGAGGCGPVSGGPVLVPITAVPCPNPAITASWIVCASSTGNIASVAKVSGNKYVWTITNGTITIGAGTNSISYKAGSLGVAILSVTVTNVSGQCSVSSGNYFVLISPLPIAVISAPASVCASSTGNIAYVPGCGVGATYAWTIGNGTITSGNNTGKITFTSGAAGSVTISVTVTNGAGCRSSSGSKVVTIAPYLVVSITAAASICSGSSGNPASVASGGIGARYSWTIINGCITSGSSTNSITYTATKSGSVTLTVIVTNSSGCSTSSGNKVVMIVALPNPNITAVASVCAGSTGNAASVSNAGTGAAYTWTISGGTITSGSGTSGIKYTAGAPGSVTLNVTVTNSNGCKASYSKKITTIGLPAATITASSSVCGASTGNTASVSSAGTGATYAWSINNGTITLGGTTSSIKYTAGSSGTVALSITVTNSTGCQATGSKNVTISAAMVPAFAQIGPLCQKSTPPSLPVKSTNGITGTWSPAKISTFSLAITTYTFTPAAGQCASSATLKITVKSCATLSNDNIVSNQQAINKAAPVMDAVILPNPTENFFILVIKGNRKEVAEVRVLDVQGRGLDHFRISTGSRVQFGGNYAHGTYIVQVLQGPDRKALKAIKQ